MTHKPAANYRPATFLKTALIRVCQPRPSLLKWLMTSGSSRIEMRCLRNSLGKGGLPRTALANHASSSSKASPSPSIYDFSVPFLLIIVCLSQRNNSDCVTTPAPNTNMKTRLDVAYRRKSLFAIIPATICASKRSIPFKERHIRKINISGLKRPLPLGFISLISKIGALCHTLNIYTKNKQSIHVSVTGGAL